MKKTVPTLYLFNNVFYPQTIIPITVSDLPTKELMLNCYTESLPFVLYYPHSRSQKIGTLGTVFLVENNDDDSITVFVQGLARVRITEILFDQTPLPLAQVEDYFDREENNQLFFDQPIERLYEILTHWLQRHISSSRERERFMKDMSSPSKLINNLCMLMIKDLELKLIFLESTSMTDRIRMMNALLVGEKPETENNMISLAIKDFERMETNQFKTAC